MTTFTVYFTDDTYLEIKAANFTLRPHDNEAIIFVDNQENIQALVMTNQIQAIVRSEAVVDEGKQERQREAPEFPGLARLRAIQPEEGRAERSRLW